MTYAPVAASRARSAYVPAACVAFAMLVTPAAALACRCMPVPAAAAARKADAVVLAMVEQGVKDAPHYARYTVRVERAWKARLPDRLTVRTRQTDCAADFSVGARYLIHLRRTAAGWETSLCAGNLPAAQASGAIRALGRSYPAAHKG